MKISRKSKKKYKKMYVRHRLLIDGVFIDTKHIRITEVNSIGFIGEYVK